MEFVVDIQGFKRPFNDFVVKEVAVVSLEDDFQPSVYLFEPPHAWSILPAKYKSENMWLQLNYHGIAWNSGDVPYDEVHETLNHLLRGAAKIYVKGLPKKRWLENIVSNVYNIEALGCPSLEELHGNATNLCSNHLCMLRVPPNCAHYNAQKLKTWILNECNVRPSETMESNIGFVQDYYMQGDLTR